ncbi:uracil phosphoribosyltransferase-domain-containing protein [Pelagophyceae sp. CCMP2097]|nr:uracil phosphoribosyltransferase-domain-containing protein [Pelagophyceae sp. CCMP2097]|mmetsp:Transcript_14791/g.51429  ORF Transcript_14791/g.51429 Transcript_14791/m.51429 type:complete len:214 (+) Transcript_14791:54-695(+)
MDPPGVVVLRGAAVRGLLTTLRDKASTQAAFVHAADRLCHLLAEEALATMPVVEVRVLSPCGWFDGVRTLDGSELCIVDIMRSGGILLEAVRRLAPTAKTAKILIQRDEATALPTLLYSKLPPRVTELQVLLCDPMLATGGSALTAVRVLLAAGVPEERIVFANVVCCPEGLAHLRLHAPLVRVITCAIDECLNEEKYIVPGLGDFGDRYYGT